MTKLTEDQIKTVKSLLATAIDVSERRMVDRIRVLERRIEDQVALITTQNDTISKLQRQLDENCGHDDDSGAATINSHSWAALVSGKHTITTAAQMVLMTKESRELADKEKNVIISGLVEKTSTAADEEEIKKVAAALRLKADSIKKARRMGKVDSTHQRPRLVLVELEDSAARDVALKNASGLRGIAGYERVFVNSDRTQNQILVDKELRRERDERNEKLPNTDDTNGRLRYDISISGKKWYWGIRWHELHKIDKETGRTFDSTSRRE